MVFGGGLIAVCIVLFSVWLSILTVLLLKSIRHYNRLTKGISVHGLGSILEELLKRERRLSDKTQKLETAVATLTDAGHFHISKIGLVRFNPFSDTGGAQSFTVALLDSRDNGLVMTSLYGRTGNRWYVKEVRNGSAKEFALSKEESAAIAQAEKNEIHE